MSLTKAQRIVLSYPPIQQRLEKNESDQQKILKNLDEIKSTFSKRSIGAVLKFLKVALNKIYKNIHLELPDGQTLKSSLKIIQLFWFQITNHMQTILL